jgi:hypothetical protein
MAISTRLMKQLVDFSISIKNPLPRGGVILTRKWADQRDRCQKERAHTYPKPFSFSDFPAHTCFI